MSFLVITFVDGKSEAELARLDAALVAVANRHQLCAPSNGHCECCGNHWRGHAWLVDTFEEARELLGRVGRCERVVARLRER